MQKLRLFRFYMLCCVLLAVQHTVSSQDTKIFTSADYDLLGPVKNCLVLTSYGQEEFTFDRDGLLKRAVTRFNDKDYTITDYKYKNGVLSERREEVYRDGLFDEATSMAHFFQHDTLETRKITEQIVNYNKILIDRYEYFFDQHGNMERIVRSSPEGIDETRIERSEQKGETTTAYFLNEVIQTSIRDSEITTSEGSSQRVVLTKNFINGLPDKAKEATYNSDDNLISEVLFEYRKNEKSFVPVSETTYTYDPKGILTSMKNAAGGQVEVKNYIFQFDMRGNWTKQIITPDNAYTTRKITYFPIETPEKNEG
jgi:hypothetical protein